MLTIYCLMQARKAARERRLSAWAIGSALGFLGDITIVILIWLMLGGPT